ncbi:HNH endonuclease protein [Rhizobium phage RHph_N3_2]|nr:HNH endonuclease protein [Rhizobium phage RHph_N3_2]
MANSRLCSIQNCGKPSRKKGYCPAHYWRFRQHGDPLGGRTPVGAPMRFIREVAMHHYGDECLTWPFGRISDGYGQVRVDNKTLIASRYICELAHGAPPTPKHEAAHNCGKGHLGCVSPNHLEWKTAVANKADKLIHGTITRGERNGRAKLTEDEVRTILSLKGEMSQRKLAERFSVSKSLISLILLGRSWAEVTNTPD